ncbi:MAG: nickel pincer cofactor biosynthesis protein LarC [Desulfobacterales bacterium]
MGLVAYFDCFSGISGDMTLGAFTDLGVPVDWLKQTIAQAPLSGFDIRVEPVSRNGIHADRVDVVVENDQPSRDYVAIRSLIEKSPFSARVKQISLDILEHIAVAEAKIHDCPKDRVHFHEVGGVDAIVDILGTALCIEYLDIDDFSASRIPTGCGFTASMHGTIPIPAPATAAILKGVPTYGTDIPFELVTPTGAAIIVSLSRAFGPRPEMVVERIGYGAGRRELESQPNLLRVMLGRAIDTPPKLSTLLEDDIVVLETNIDDMNSEHFGYVMEKLQSAGALDICWIPVYMKKNRPGIIAQVLCRFDHQQSIMGILLSETTSLGIRSYDVHRYMLDRKEIVVETVYGKIRAKEIKTIDGGHRIAPEYEACKGTAAEHGIPLQDVYEAVIAASVKK